MKVSNSVPQIQRLVPGLIEKVGAEGQKPATLEEGAEGKFGDLFANLLNSVNQLQIEAGQAQQALMAGEPIELHEVMIKAEEAGISLDLLLEIRNKLVSAYNEIMRMPM